MRKAVVISLVGLAVLLAVPCESEAFVFSIKSIKSAFGAEGVPVPPSSRKVQENENRFLINGKDGKVKIYWYKSELSAEEITDFYKRTLGKEGWVGSEVGNQNQLLFRKDGAWISVVADGSNIFIQHAPKMDIPTIALDVDKDAPGKDLTWPPRYPGSVRILCVENPSGGALTLAYRSRDKVEDILSFYEEKLVSAGWEKKDSVYANSNFSKKIAKVTERPPLYFRSKKGICLINATYHEQLRLSFVSIVYNPVVIGE